MIDSKITWKIDPVQALQSLSSGIKNKAMRIALNAGAAPVKAAAIAQAPQDTGNLKKAMRIKTKNYRNSNCWVAMIGASKSFKRTKKPKSKKATRREVRPGNYQSLVERGTKHFTGRHFLERAMKSTRQQFVDTVRRKLQEIISQLIAGNKV